MNKEFVNQFHSGVCNLFSDEENGEYQNHVCFSKVDEKGHYMICLTEEDPGMAYFYQHFHKVLMEDFGIPVKTDVEDLGDCFTLGELQKDIEYMIALDPTEVALYDVIPDCVKRVAAIAEYEEAAVTEDFIPVIHACFELVFRWKQAIADRYFGGLLMADAALISVFFKLAKEYVNKE